MQIYIDESGSITNKLAETQPYFVICLVKVRDGDVHRLRRVYKRFVSGNIARLRQLDVAGKMFRSGHFQELKGSQFDREMKHRFVDFFAQNNLFELYYLKLFNNELHPVFFRKSSLTFNYQLLHALEYFFAAGLLPQESCRIELDERNERVETRHYLENFLNTELVLSRTAIVDFKVSYYDSAANPLVQLADVFSNLYYAHLKTGAYSKAFARLHREGYLKYIYDVPFHPGETFEEYGFRG